MKTPAAYLSSFVERSLAFVLLVYALPTLLVVGLLLRVNSEKPVLLLDPVRVGSTTARRYRLRTTGAGSGAFHAIGRWVRAFSLDEFPGLWSVVCGHIRLSQLIQLRKLL